MTLRISAFPLRISVKSFRRPTHHRLYIRAQAVKPLTVTTGNEARMADHDKTCGKQATGMECERPSIMAPNGTCERMQENPHFQQSVLVSTCPVLVCCGRCKPVRRPDERSTARRLTTHKRLRFAQPKSGTRVGYPAGVKNRRPGSSLLLVSSLVCVGLRLCLDVNRHAGGNWNLNTLKALESALAMIGGLLHALEELLFLLQNARAFQ